MANQRTGAKYEIARKSRKRLLEFIVSYRQTHKISPSLDEMAEEIGRTKSSVHTSLRVLERDGLIRLEPFIPRCVVPL